MRPDDTSPRMAQIFRAVGNALVADHVAVEVTSALERAGIAVIVLRGPAVARHLYDATEVRPYVDVDLLISQDRREEAERILLDLGFRYVAVLGGRPDDRPAWSSTWSRSRDRANVDLHWTLAGARAKPADVWRVIEAEREQLRVLDRSIAGTSAAATALIVTLHAAHHGVQVTQPVRDLERALARLSFSTWSRALELAEKMGAVESFAAGLRLSPEGERVARDLDVPEHTSAETILRASSAPPMALGFDWLAHTPGIPAKLRLIAGKVFPDAQFMRAWSPHARSGTKRGLALAYAWRPIWLAWHSVPGLRAWLDARRRARA